MFFTEKKQIRKDFGKHQSTIEAPSLLEQQLEWSRLRRALDRMAEGKIKMVYPPKVTPLAFSLMVDKLRERVSSETLAERVGRMQKALEKTASDETKNQS